MDWHHPEALYLILPLCTAWLLLTLYSERRRQAARRAFVAQTMWSRVLPEESRRRLWLKCGLREVAIIAGLVAVAGPSFGTQIEQVIPRGSDLYVLIDVSRSMLADDVIPSRLGRAKADVSSLLNRLEGERVGLIAFAGQAVVKCPLTIDYDSFRRSLEELDPDSAPRGGTAIGDAIRKALEVLQAKADRDQAILLITDGDDQDSYPLEAAAVAAERHVAIFTVGLGDAERGSRVPQRGAPQTYVEHDGNQVWSKLQGNLLQEIAVKTSGVYVPAGTRAYDLGELYVNHLQGRRGNDSASQQRVRRTEQFQMFLAIALAALLIDLCTGSYRNSRPQPSGESVRSGPAAAVAGAARGRNVLPVVGAFCALSCGNTLCSAAGPDGVIRDGLQLYAQSKFDEAREKFAAAGQELDKQKSAAVAVAAFDEACALHRQGELDRARDAYLRAGLSPDRPIATAAHFNLGNLSAEQAHKLAGERPEAVPPDKRQEILDQIKQAVAAYRHCLELQHDHAAARRNLELVREWIKYYSDRWQDLDRQKRRDESNLLTFLEFLIQTQTALCETVKQLPRNTRSDQYAELKRAQEELHDELPTLREKIAAELRPQPSAGAATGAAAPDSKEFAEAISLLQGWANEAADKMSVAGRRLGAREAARAAVEQQGAVDELDKIWDAVIPFSPLLARDLADQSAIAHELSRKRESDQNSERASTTNEDAKPDADAPTPRTENQQLDRDEIDPAKMSPVQQRTLRKTRLLIPKAQSELERLEATAPNDAAGADAASKSDRSGSPTTVDPEQAKAGLRVAIELAPRAVEQMESAITSLKEQDRSAAGEHAEQARRILEEIQQAQPRNEQKPDQPQDQHQDQQPKPDQKQDQQDKPDEKKKQDQQDSKPDANEEREKGQQPKPRLQQGRMSPDRIEDALRKVRERQQEKRERDRKLKGLIPGRTPVDKDW